MLSCRTTRAAVLILERNRMKKNPFPYTDTNKRYHTYDYDMRMRFGGKCVKIPLDGGFTCPNIDGTKGQGGCAYCTKAGLPLRGRPLREQYKAGVQLLQPKWGRQMEVPRYIPYFQTFSGTYAPIEKLERLWREAIRLPGAVGLAIATRADCLTLPIAELLREIGREVPVTVELGLQTVHDATAQRIGRGHSFDEFLAGYALLDGVRKCVHLIDGLPGEDWEMMLQTARKMAELAPEEIKFHFLYIAKGTEMEQMYLRGEVRALTLEEYISILAAQLEILPPEITIGRISGDAQEEELIAPQWSRKKLVIMNELDKYMVKNDTFQGRLCKITKN